MHTAIDCAWLALAGLLLVAVTWRRARQADIRQIVREEMRSGAARPLREMDR